MSVYLPYFNLYLIANYIYFVFAHHMTIIHQVATVVHYNDHLNGWTCVVTVIMIDHLHIIKLLRF